MFKRRKLSRTEKKDLRDNTALAISAAGLGVSVAALALSLNKRPMKCTKCSKHQFTQDGRMICSMDRFNSHYSDRCIRSDYSKFTPKRK